MEPLISRPKMESGDLFFVYIGSAAFIYLSLTEGLGTLKDVKLVSERGANAISLRNQAFKAVGYSCLVAVFAFPLIAPLEFYTDYYMVSSYLSVMVFAGMLREREKKERDVRT